MESPESWEPSRTQARRRAGHSPELGRVEFPLFPSSSRLSHRLNFKQAVQFEGSLEVYSSHGGDGSGVSGPEMEEAVIMAESVGHPLDSALLSS